MIKNLDIALPSSLPHAKPLRAGSGRVLKLCPVIGLNRWLTTLLALGWLTGAWGGTLSDPTVPAPAWLAEHPVASGTAGTVGQEVSTDVQLMIIGKSRKFALVDGQVIKPGDAFNGSKVLDIKADEVVTQDASKSLRLIPSVEKKLVSSATPTNAGKTTSKRKEFVNGSKQ